MTSELFTVPISENEIALDRAAFENWLRGIPTIGAWGDTTPTPEVARRLANKRQQWMTDAKARDAIGTQLLRTRMAAQRIVRETNLLRYLDLVKQADALRTLTRGVFQRGAPCSHCGGTLRYTSDNKCVTCRRAQARAAYNYVPVTDNKFWREARAAARAVGSKHFHGKPCTICGSTLRYVSNKNCISCERTRTARRAAA